MHTSSDLFLDRVISRYFQKKVSAHLLAVVDSFTSWPSESSGACQFPARDLLGLQQKIGGVARPAATALKDRKAELRHESRRNSQRCAKISFPHNMTASSMLMETSASRAEAAPSPAHCCTGK